MISNEDVACRLDWAKDLPEAWARLVTLWANHDRHYPEAALTFGLVQIGADMIELAVVPAPAIGLLQAQHRDPLRVRERMNLLTEPITDLGEGRRMGDRVPQMIG